MDVHKNARTTPHGRRLMVQCLAQGAPCLGAGFVGARPAEKELRLVNRRKNSAQLRDLTLSLADLDRFR